MILAILGCDWIQLLLNELSISKQKMSQGHQDCAVPVNEWWIYCAWRIGEEVAVICLHQKEEALHEIHYLTLINLLARPFWYPPVIFFIFN